MPDLDFLCELLHNKDMEPCDIALALGVKPYRLRQMLNSKRLAARLEAIEALADKKAEHAVFSGIAPAMHKMTKLTGSHRPETARQACLNILDTAVRIHSGKNRKTERT